MEEEFNKLPSESQNDDIDEIIPASASDETESNSTETEQLNADENESSEEIIQSEEDTEEPEDLYEKESTSEIIPPSYKVAKGILDYMEIFVVAITVVLMVFSFLFRLCIVNGPSMERTLFDGEKLITTNLFYEPDYGDIIVFYQTSKKIDNFNEAIVKRVIAKAGDKVDIDFNTWTLYINDKPVDEDYRYLSGAFTRGSELKFPLVVDEGCLFVMGDNRNNSSDSRISEIGFVDKRRILGKVILRITPFDKFGPVD